VHRWVFLLLAWLMPGLPASAALLAELDTSTPQATVASFLSEARRMEALFLAYRAAPSTATETALTTALTRTGRELFDLRDAPPVTRIKHGAMAFGLLADILHRLPALDPNSPPPDPQATRWTIPGTEIRLIRLPDADGRNWVFSAETLARLPEFRAALGDAPVLAPVGIPDWAEFRRNFTGPLLAKLPLDRLPGPLQWDLLGSPAWKVLLTLVVLAVVGLIGLACLRFALRRAKGMAPWRRHLAMLLVAAVFVVLLDRAYVFITWQIVLVGGISDIGLLFTNFAIYLAAAWAAWSACWLVAEAIIAAPRFPGRVYDANLLRLLARVCSLLAAATLIVLGANQAGVPALGLLAGVSIGGLALALAAQATVENLLGGISIFADRPFRVGDTIAFGTARGVVIAIGPRSSQIRGLDGAITSVPNADLAKVHVTNLSARDRWIFQHRLRVPREMPAERIATLVEALRARLAAEPLVETAPGWPRVHVAGIGRSNLSIQIAAQIVTQDEASFLGIQQVLILDALRAVEEAQQD
jgi:MscS family membrane protein